MEGDFHKLYINDTPGNPWTSQTATDRYQEGEFSLIHIPLPLYSLLLQPILRVLLPYKEIDPSHNNDEEESLIFDQEHGFLNISITPIECSVVCHKSWAETVFQPIIDSLPKDENNKVHISTDNYIVFSVDSTGTDAGQRVMDLTSPLAMAGIPIFFITTYYTDFILVPSKDRQAVGQTLLSRGFEFSEEESAYVVPTPNSHSRGPSSNSNHSNPPSTPPPSNIAELQARTFKHLKRRNVKPFVQPGLRLVQCSGRDRMVEERPLSNGNGNGHHPPSPLDKLNTRLYISIISALIHQPTFLSLTISLEEGSSLLFDKTLLPLFGSSIQGDTDGDLVPIFLDLVDLPLESTGIVCGVAGKLVDEMRLNDRPDEEGGNEWGLDLSYLSTARAGAVVLSARGSERALEMLGGLLEGVAVGEV